MKQTKIRFKPEFINVLIALIKSNNIIIDIGELRCDDSYTVDYIADIICVLSKKTYGRYKLPNELSTYFKLSPYAKLTLASIRKHVIDEKCEPLLNNFINTYVVIGYDVPVTINELNVVV